MLERRATEHCSSLSGIVLDYMQASALNPASKDVGCAVSPGHGNCVTSPVLWRAPQRSVAGLGRHQALSFAQPPVGRHPEWRFQDLRMNWDN